MMKPCMLQEDRSRHRLPRTDPPSNVHGVGKPKEAGGVDVVSYSTIFFGEQQTLKFFEIC